MLFSAIFDFAQDYQSRNQARIVLQGPLDKSHQKRFKEGKQ